MQSSASVLSAPGPVGEAEEEGLAPSLTLEELRSVNESLSEVSAAVEMTFLGASKRTMQTVRDLRHVNHLVESLVEKPDTPIARRIEMLAIDARVLQPDSEMSSAEWDKLHAVARKVEAMCVELESLDRCYQMFPVLRVLTQIHGSSLNEESRDLDWFADAIGSEAHRGSEVVGNLLVTVTRQFRKLRSSIRGAFEGERQLGEELLDCEAVMLRSAEKMGTLEQGHERALQSLQERQRAISSATTDLVSSMQFQDAFRQRVEHVQRALEQLESLQQQRVLPGFEGNRVLTSGELGVAQTVLVSIVNDQTAALSNDLAQTHTQLDKSLYRLGEQSSALGDDLELTLRSSEQKRLEELLELTQRAYGNQVGQLASVYRGRAAIATSLQVSLAEMDADLLALEQVGEAIFLLAVNAVVLAARLGAEGRAIEQIAQQVRSNSTEAGMAIRLVRKLTEELRSLCGSPNQDQAGEEAVPAHAESSASLATEMPAASPDPRSVLRTDKDLRARSADLMLALEQRSEQSDEVIGFCRNIHGGYTATRSDFAGLRQAMRAMSQTSVAWAARAEEHTLDPNLHPDLVRGLASFFASHYTMESERITQKLALMTHGDSSPATEQEPVGVVTLEDGGADDDDLSDILF